MRNINKNRGFTLVEVLFVVVVVGIMSSVLLPGYSTLKRNKAMSYAKTQIVNSLRYAQDSTLSGMKFPGDTYPPKGGYGVRFQTASGALYIFGDDNAGVPNKAYELAEKLEQVDLTNGVYISSITVNGVATSPVDYVCMPPYGTGFINGAQSRTMIITIKSSDNVLTSTITVGSSGYIS